MVIYIKKGDIFKIDEVTSYAHGCNCVGAMGAGIALQFKRKFPDMYEEYHKMCMTCEFTVGSVFDYDYGNGHIYNLATQYHYNRRGQMAKIPYIKDSLNKMIELAEESGVDKIAMPAIGAGLGGLEWNDVKKVIDDVCSENKKVTVYVVETYG